VDNFTSLLKCHTPLEKCHTFKTLQAYQV